MKANGPCGNVTCPPKIDPRFMLGFGLILDERRYGHEGVHSEQVIGMFQQSRTRRYTNHPHNIIIPYNPLIFQEKSFLFNPAKTPVTSLFHKAQKFENLLTQGVANSQTELARRQGISQPTVSQILNLLKLTPEIKEYITNLTDQAQIKFFTQRRLIKMGKVLF